MGGSLSHLSRVLVRKGDTPAEGNHMNTQQENGSLQTEGGGL